MTKDELLQASSRMALAGMLHDVGKFTERAKISVESTVEQTHQQLYCPQREAGGRQWHTHKHAAYSAIGIDLIEDHAPDLIGEDFFPFANWKSTDSDDSLINAAAGHHKPRSYLQWIVATADRVASGFEREKFEEYNKAEEKNHYQSRQLTLFEQVFSQQQDLKFRYQLEPLSPATLFPIEAKGYEVSDNAVAQAEYRKLWEEFTDAITQIPPSHRQQLPLWLDHFDTLWLSYTHSIPSATAFGTKPEVSLYDHSKAVTALAVALWRYHFELDHDKDRALANMQYRKDWDEKKLLMIQGDFFGIQNFIFSQGSESNKKAAKLLRGRSLYVSLITECAALTILEQLALPSTSQIINAAGKFLIVAPNTPETIAVLETIKKEFNQWFLDHSYGQSGLGLAWEGASCNDFVNSKKEKRFGSLMKALHAQLERSKYAHFNLCGEDAAPAVFEDYLNGFTAPCEVNDKAPAQDNGLSLLASDQIKVGDLLVKKQRIMITKRSIAGVEGLIVPLFGYSIQFTNDEEQSGKFGAEVKKGNIRRFFDFSYPDLEKNKVLWNGYARRNISGYVPRFTEQDSYQADRYSHCANDELVVGQLKTFNHLANEDKWLDAATNKWRGISALGVVKGDIDDLGTIFHQGLDEPTFAKMAALSRQVNSFFAVFLPWLCRTKYRDTYIIFAGGDDFFFLGPWKQQIELANELRVAFKHYVAENSSIHFSAGIAVVKPGLPVYQIAEMGEKALGSAKKYDSGTSDGGYKNAVTCFDQTVSWNDFERLWAAKERLRQLSEDYSLSTAFIYGLLELTDMAANDSKPENAMWRSKFYYRTQRMIANDRRLSSDQKQQARTQIVTDIGESGIKQFKADYRMALQAYIYENRDQN